MLNNPPSEDKEEKKAQKKKKQTLTQENEKLKEIYNKYKLKSDEISNDMLRLFANHEKIVQEEEEESYRLSKIVKK